MLRNLTRLRAARAARSLQLARPASTQTGPAAAASGAARRQVTVDRPLPDVLGDRRRHRIYFGVFCAVMAASLLGMVQYEAANSPIVSSTLAALRRSQLCHECVGPNVRFASSMPWVSGSTGIAKDEVDFSYRVVGDAGSATVRFRAVRVPGELRYLMERWSITPDQGPHRGEPVDLVQEEYVPHVPLSNKEEPRAVRRA